MSYLIKVILEEHGYDVRILNAYLAPIFASLSRKKADVFMDVWLPVTMHDYMEQYGDKLEVIGNVYDNARIGLVVPEYVTIQSIEELNGHKDKFSSQIIGIDAGAGIIKHYRVDKMRDTEILEADRKGEESFKNFDLAAFAKKTFGMFGGVDAEVTLECRNELAGVVIDRFGHDVWMCPHGEDHFRARVPVAVSSQFFGWITGIGSGMRIVGPEDVRQQYKEYLQNVIQNYMD